MAFGSSNSLARFTLLFQFTSRCSLGHCCSYWSSYGIIGKIAGYLSINFGTGDVSCMGVIGLLLLPFIYFTTAIMMVLFDSSIFVFLRTVPEEYKHHTAHFMHLLIPNPRAACEAEYRLIRGVLFGLESGFKNIVQISIASMGYEYFVPAYMQTTATCQGPYKHGGYPYSETLAVWMATIVFWAMSPAVIHTLLNTFVSALPPGCRRIRNGPPWNGQRQK